MLNSARAPDQSLQSQNCWTRYITEPDTSCWQITQRGHFAIIRYMRHPQWQLVGYRLPREGLDPWSSVLAQSPASWCWPGTSDKPAAWRSVNNATGKESHRNIFQEKIKQDMHYKDRMKNAKICTKTQALPRLPVPRSAKSVKSWNCPSSEAAMTSLPSAETAEGFFAKIDVVCLCLLCELAKMMKCLVFDGENNKSNALQSYYVAFTLS